MLEHFPKNLTDLQSQNHSVAKRIQLQVQTELQGQFMQQNMRFQESFAKGVSEISGQHEEGGKILVGLVQQQMDCKMMEVEARINQILTEHRVEYRGGSNITQNKFQNLRDALSSNQRLKRRDFWLLRRHIGS